MDKLATILRKELEKYAKVGFNGRTELTVNSDGSVFTLVTYGRNEEKRFTFPSLIVSLFNETIIIEEDRNNKPLVDALVQAGIAREKIILAYAGEEVPQVIDWF